MRSSVGPKRPACRQPCVPTAGRRWIKRLRLSDTHRRLCSRRFLPRPFPSAAAAEGKGSTMQAGRRGAEKLAAAFHSSAAALSKSTPRIRFSVREKLSDAKSALKNILLNGGPCQESSNKQTRKQKVSVKSKGLHSFPGKNRQRKNKCGQNWRNFDEDECIETPYGTFGGQRSFTWYWPGENDDGGTPSGFQWRNESQSTRPSKTFWNESDIDEEEESVHDNLQNHRMSLGLPLQGPLKLDQIKSAFRTAALKWHPDKHQGPSQAEAEEKFRQCVEAYSALTCTFKSSG